MGLNDNVSVLVEPRRELACLKKEIKTIWTESTKTFYLSLIFLILSTKKMRATYLVAQD